MADQVITRGVSLYPVQWAAIDAFAKDNGLNRSSALRMIIRMWLDSERQKVSLVREPERVVANPAQVMPAKTV